MVVPTKSKQNRGIAFSQSFIKQVNIDLIFMLHAMVFVTYSLNKIVGSLFHSLVSDGINHAAQDTSTRTIRIYRGFS